MIDHFFYFYFSYLNYWVYGLVSILGIYGASLLLKRTRNRGPLLVLLTCIVKVVVGVTFPLLNYLDKLNSPSLNTIQTIYLAFSLADLIATMLLLLGIVLIARDFRALLDARALQNPGE